jgi:protein SFI1
LLGQTDLRLIEEVLRMAEENASASGGGNFTLLDALKAYDAVLRRHHILPAEDTYYYRFLLKLSLDADTNWWHKFEREKQVSCCALVPGWAENVPAPP